MFFFSCKLAALQHVFFDCHSSLSCACHSKHIRINSYAINLWTSFINLKYFVDYAQEQQIWVLCGSSWRILSWTFAYMFFCSLRLKISNQHLATISNENLGTFPVSLAHSFHLMHEFSFYVRLYILVPTPQPFSLWHYSGHLVMVWC